ncbi:hypothetical protein C6P40_004082 [Pichia californica]|uniref:Myb-like domain-containing protein n=1 Tax=Pichia californica TaxID=460514 RepID=A0A9P7BEA5_9ASCO|nr:hypothetical protein C6P42_003776 [[Candida] californica]KAG0686449.1 hypothetical protein C6P40_004082 [[Candida] californica]
MMQQPLNYPIYYQPTVSPSFSSTSISTPINPNYPYQKQSGSYGHPQSFLRANSYQYGLQNNILSYPPNNKIINNSSLLSLTEKINTIESFDKNPIMNHPTTIHQSQNMPMKYIYPSPPPPPPPHSFSQQYIPQIIMYNDQQNSSFYQHPQQQLPSSHPISIRYDTSQTIHPSPMIYNDRHMPQIPLSIKHSNTILNNDDNDSTSICSSESINNNSNNNNNSIIPLVEKNNGPNTTSNTSNSNSIINSGCNSNITNLNTSLNEVLPQSNDISVLTPIPGCMAYHHPLIPIIPSASGNTRKYANRLLDNKIHTNLLENDSGMLSPPSSSSSSSSSCSSTNLSQQHIKKLDSVERSILGNNGNDNNNINMDGRRMAFGSPIWTSKDDELLRHLKEIEKIGWRDISMYFPTRTINACQFRWRRLVLKEENKKKREAHKLAIKKKILKNKKL